MKAQRDELVREIEARERAVRSGAAPLDAQTLGLLLLKHATALMYVQDRGRLCDLFDLYGFSRGAMTALPPRIETPTIMRDDHVLVVDLRLIGDAVNAGELCAAIRERFGACVSYLGANGNSAVLAPCGLDALYDLMPRLLAERIDGVEMYAAFLADTAKLQQSLAAARFSVVINLNKSPSAMLLTRMCAARRVYGWTFDDSLRIVFVGSAMHERLYDDVSMHLLEGMLRTVFSDAPARATKPLFHPEDLYDVPSGAVGFFIGARFMTRRWESPQWAALAAHIAATHTCPVVIFGGKAERALAREIDRASGGICIDVCGKIPLERLGPAMARCALMVTNDSGGKHAAAAGDVPCIEVSGAGIAAEQCGPFAARSFVVQADVPCIHCNKPVCERDHECMRHIAAAPIARLVDDALAKGDDDPARLRLLCGDPLFEGLIVAYTGSVRPDIGHRLTYLRGGTR
jgi:ADP-heptose:LPS heptosyltransferase